MALTKMGYNWGYFHPTGVITPFIIGRCPPGRLQLVLGLVLCPFFGILRTTPSSTLESVWPMFTRRTKSVAADGNNQYGQTISPFNGRNPTLR